MIHRSPLADISIPELPVTAFVLRGARELTDKVALLDGPTGRGLTYGALDEAVRRYAGGLLASGLRKGEVVALMAPNCPEYAIVFHGVAMAGGVVTTVNPAYSAREVRHQLKDAGATRLVTVAAFLDVANEAIEGTQVRETRLLDEGGAAPTIFEVYGEALAEHVPVDLDDVVALPYSSGTTGLSKGVMLTHRNLVASIAQNQRVLSLQPDEAFVAVLPFFHIYGMQVLLNVGLASGVTIVTLPRFDLEQFLTLHQQHGLTRAFVAPPVVLALAKQRAVGSYDLSALRTLYSGAAPLAAELALECSSRLGCEVVQAYGMTELSGATHLTLEGGLVPGSVGMLVPNTEVRIVDPGSGEDLGVLTSGEVWIRGPQVMKGYLANPGATMIAIDKEGWLHTGDIGYVNGAGHLFVIDRLKELIKYKGYQVAPAELEALLLTHPAVGDCAVVGLPDEEAGEIPIAYVALKPDHEATADDLETYIAERVAHYKRVRHIAFIEEIPKSASGKILRRILRDNMPAASQPSGG